ncbi:hypothetical protein D3C86_1377130 [compost metagenome]
MLRYRFQCTNDVYCPFFGKLDGITHKIDQHLVDPERIAPNCPVNIRLPVDMQLYTFLAGFIFQYMGNILYDLVQVKSDMFQDDLT